MTRDRARRYFLEQLVKYRQIECYWHCGRLVTRSIHLVRTLRRGKVSLPAGAQFIGVYAYPFNPHDFLRDLDDALATIRHHAVDKRQAPAMA